MNPAGPVSGTKLLAGRCRWCRRDVFSVRAADTGRVVTVEPQAVRGLLVVGPLRRPAFVAGWDAWGKPLVVNPEAAEGGTVEVYPDHGGTCLQTARASGRTPEQVPDQGTCRGCGAAMLWIRTLEGRRVPLDPEPQDGPSHEGGGAPKGWAIVRGYDLRGACRAILKRAPGAPFELFAGEGSGPQDRVYVSHFATCPRRDDFKRDRPGGHAGNRRT